MSLLAAKPAPGGGQHAQSLPPQNLDPKTLAAVVLAGGAGACRPQPQQRGWGPHTSPPPDGLGSRQRGWGPGRVGLQAGAAWRAGRGRPAGAGAPGADGQPLLVWLPQRRLALRAQPGPRPRAGARGCHPCTPGRAVPCCAALPCRLLCPPSPACSAPLPQLGEAERLEPHSSWRVWDSRQPASRRSRRSRTAGQGAAPQGASRTLHPQPPPLAQQEPRVEPTPPVRPQAVGEGDGGTGSAAEARQAQAPQARRQAPPDAARHFRPAVGQGLAPQVRVQDPGLRV